MVLCMNVDALCRLVWGRPPHQGVSTESLGTNVFEQWLQPISFSRSEPTALVQLLGGPCAVLAPLQGHVLKHVLFNEPRNDLSSDRFTAINRTFTEADQRKVLANTITTIISRASSVKSVAESARVYKLLISGKNDHSFSQLDLGVAFTAFHNSLFLKCFDSEASLHQAVLSSLNSFLSPGGVLLLLYSLLESRGLERVKYEIGPLEADNPLIDSVHGHGSLSVTMLCITGTAVTNLFDGEKNMDGLSLFGVTERPVIGYLSLLEYFRYLEVGSLLKNPELPLWVVASETHLTLLFALDKSLCDSASTEAAAELARRQFKVYDTDEKGFIDSTQLSGLLTDLKLPDDEESVSVALIALDPEQWGIIPLASFLDHFYPLAVSEEYSVMTDIPFVHYNGLYVPSSPNRVSSTDNTPVLDAPENIRFVTGIGVIGLTSSACEVGADPNSCNKLDLILSTKWPAISISWHDGAIPTVD